MHDPLAIPRRWKWVTMGLAFAVMALVLALLAWLIWRAGVPTCESGSQLSDRCDPYLPGVPGKEGR